MIFKTYTQNDDEILSDICVIASNRVRIHQSELDSFIII